MKVTRCIYCGRPVATDADWKRDDWGDDGSSHLCWNSNYCSNNVDEAYRKLLKYMLLTASWHEQISLKMVFQYLSSCEPTDTLKGDTIETEEVVG